MDRRTLLGAAASLLASSLVLLALAFALPQLIRMTRKAMKARTA